MREIKFRAWFELEKKMVESANLGLQYEGDEEQPFTFAFDKSDLIERENGEVHEKGTLCFELMQYTGLKDKNSKEIFEGDIVKTASLDEYSVIDTNKPAVVIIDNFSWMLKQGDEPDYFEFLSNLQNNLIVIGNIYENPELLGGADH